MPVTYSGRAVQELITRIRSGIHRPARDARVAVSGGPHLVTIRSHPGAAVDGALPRRQLSRALTAPMAPHLLGVPVRTAKPRVTTAMLASEYPANIVIDRPDCSS
jgi:hypothetical protein